ncbi:MAG: hypothetical protein J7M09_03390 [Deltaproteobacteria bacterium]|nr:hypothetical protein [Candidatus Tharpella sp.]
MKTKRKTISLALLLGVVGFLSLSFMITGCTTQNAMIIAPPTCAQALDDRFNDYTDYEIARLLDEALNESCQECIYSCWIPLMQRALDDSREIPHRHLLRAVKIFNQQQYSEYFHTAVYRYFRDLSRGQGSYRTVDRELLRAYCTMLINDSHSRGDRDLAQAMELCHRLDPALYGKMFR